MKKLSWKIAILITAPAVLTLLTAWHSAMQLGTAIPPESVTTYHYDNFRTGWNPNEGTLTPSNVNAGSFGLLHNVALDEQVDAQPLIVPNQPITAGSHRGTFEVVYVATENNTIYAIDAATGTVLLTRNLGAPVPKPLGCSANSVVVGINSTPVIDLTAKVMYVISYVNLGSGTTKVPTYFVHELNLNNLADKVAAVQVRASRPLVNGSTYQFDASLERQRPGLLEANGNIYAGFASWCDFKAASTRGWVLGWQEGTLRALNPGKLTDTQLDPVNQPAYHLTAVWMSGYGLAADEGGDIYFSTGNSDRYRDDWDGVTDIQESVVRLSHSDLNTIVNIFAPTDEFTGRDQHDRDLGAGGVLLLPAQGGSTPSLAVIGGKAGLNETPALYLLDRNMMTGKGQGILEQINVGACWCGQSYFNDGAPHVVSSGGNTVHLLDLQTGSSPKLTDVASQSIDSGQDPGFFTTVSSSGSTNAIIWAVARPHPTKTNPSTNIKLYALNGKPSGTSLPILFMDSKSAGSWPHTTANANIVPVVANGRVFVASFQSLTIYGLFPTGATPAAPSPALGIVQNTPATSPNEIFGTITSVNGSLLTIQPRTGTRVQVDASAAIQNDLAILLEVGEAVDIQGALDSSGVFVAASIQHAKHDPNSWPADN
jgi:outer membrane protein assembly factor BamB